ncbi:MAG: ABC transporter permease, partial [Verrucomicrobiaceae bacterium]
MKRILPTLLALTAAVFVAGCGKKVEISGDDSKSSNDKQLTIAFMPKSKGNAYFIAAKKGADEAAKELGVKLLYEGPTEPDPARQNEIVEQWIQRGVDVIAAACENKEGIATALR